LREAVALAALRHIAQAFHTGEPGWSEERLARKLSMPLRVLRETLRQLVRSGFVVQVGGSRGTFYPARELDAIALSEVILSLRGHGAACYLRDEEQAAQLLETVDRAVAQALEGITLKELAVGEKTPPVVDKGGPVDI
jgi:membrane protein